LVVVDIGTPAADEQVFIRGMSSTESDERYEVVVKHYLKGRTAQGIIQNYRSGAFFSSGSLGETAR
jgi:hypothetical protein